MPIDRFIKSQGDLDGACFLYSLVNAVNCLRGRAIRTSSGWQRLIGAVYDPRDFLRNDLGTARVDEFPEIIVGLIRDYVQLLDASNEFIVERVEIPDETLLRLRRLVSEDAVLLVDNGTHWFVLVDVDQREMFAACSAALFEDPHNYVETRSPILGRIYNTSFDLEKLEFQKKTGYRLSIKA